LRFRGFVFISLGALICAFFIEKKYQVIVLMKFINHIIEPTKLLLAWQSLDSHRIRYVVAELNRTPEGVSLTYLVNTEDFRKAQQRGFEFYPAFQDINKTHYNVLDTFMRRLPPRTRGDFTQYLEGIRLKPDSSLSDFALLGYSGAKLLSDGFSMIHPFNNVNDECELLLEVAGFRHIEQNDSSKIEIGARVTFLIEEKNPIMQEPAIGIMLANRKLGYVNRGLIQTILAWINNGRIVSAQVEKINGTPGRPALYIYVQVSEKK
jgi:hypothetical protein